MEGVNQLSRTPVASRHEKSIDGICQETNETFPAVDLLVDPGG